MESMQSKPNKDAVRRTWAEASTYTHLGFTMAASVLLFFFGGNWLDNKFETSPLLSIAGAFIGATGGFVNLVRTLNKHRKNNEAKIKNTGESA